MKTKKKSDLEEEPVGLKVDEVYAKLQEHEDEIDGIKTGAEKLNRQVRAAFDTVKAEFGNMQEGVDAE